MKAFATATIGALLILATAEAGARPRPIGTGQRINIPPGNSNHFSWERGHGFRGGFGGVWVIEREVPVIVEKEVVREVAVPTPSPSPKGEGKRKPYAVGSSYSSLPSGCMKLIEDGASYYFCGGEEWYRLVGKQYRAVARKL